MITSLIFFLIISTKHLNLNLFILQDFIFGSPNKKGKKKKNFLLTVISKSVKQNSFSVHLSHLGYLPYMQFFFVLVNKRFFRLTNHKLSLVSTYSFIHLCWDFMKKEIQRFLIASANCQRAQCWINFVLLSSSSQLALMKPHH